jgi:hypothetical protein
VTRRLKGEEIATLGELLVFCNWRGANWWRSIPGIGRGRTRAIMSCSRKRQVTLQMTVETNFDSIEPKGSLVATELVKVVPAGREAMSAQASARRAFNPAVRVGLHRP